MKTTIARTAIYVSVILCVTAYAPLFGASVRAEEFPGDSYEMFYPEQLDNLTARIALYPDPLLAQVLLAASFPQQIDEAARFLRAGANPDAIDRQPWDVSVKAVAHYPTVLFMMADDLDWTAALGQAYVYQSTDVMMAVQRLRARAHASGHLVATPQMAVVVNSGYISLWPVHPRYLYVPVYDPGIVFFGRAAYGRHSVISFGLGFAIGAWLNYDCDWHRHRIYYHGWVPRRPWVHRYRPHVHITHTYVHKRFTHVHPNRAVLHHRVNYSKLSRHRAVHRHVDYKNIRIRRGDLEHRPRRIVSETRRQRERRIIRRDLRDNRRPTVERRVDRRRTIRDSRRVPETKQYGLRTNRSVSKPDTRLREGPNRPAFRSNRRDRDARASLGRTETRREWTNRLGKRSPERQRERENRQALGSPRARDGARASTERTEVRRERANRSVRQSPQRSAERRERPAFRSGRAGAGARVSTDRTEVRRERMSRSMRRSQDRRMERRERSAYRGSRTEGDRRARGRRR